MASVVCFILSLLSMFQLHSVCRGQINPCTNYQLIAMADGFRSSDFYSLDTTVSICDAYVDPATWYRFEHDAGNRLLEGPIEPWHCGTQAPIWLNGTHPTGATEKTVKVCASYSTESLCHWSGSVRIRYCNIFGSTYFVYLLAVPPGCPLAYCVDAASRKQCVPPEIWISNEFRCRVDESSRSTIVSNTPASSVASAGTSPTTVRPPTGPGWTEWGPWSVCSKQCDYGLQNRRRVCGQLPCNGPSTMNQLCNEYNCKKILDQLDKGIIFILKALEAVEDSLLKVVENERIANELLRSAINEICSQNASFCCGNDYKGILTVTGRIEFVTLSDIYPVQGVIHSTVDRTVFYQLMAVVNEDVDRTVCKNDSLRQTRQVTSHSPRFLTYDALKVATVNCSDRILQNTGLTVVEYLDPSPEYNNDNSQCPVVCVVLAVVVPALVVGAAAVVVVGIVCVKCSGKRNPPIAESPPLNYNTTIYPNGRNIYFEIEESPGTDYNTTIYPNGRSSQIEGSPPTDDSMDNNGLVPNGNSPFTIDDNGVVPNGNSPSYYNCVSDIPVYLAPRHIDSIQAEDASHSIKL